MPVSSDSIAQRYRSYKLFLIYFKMSSKIRTQLLRLQSFSRYLTRRKMSQTSTVLNTPEPQPAEKPLSIPQPDGTPKVYSAKLEQIYESISQLNLLEVAELTDLLKKRLNLPDAPVMSFGAMPAAAGSQPQVEEEAPQIVQTSFTVKLMSYDESQKVALIKELKTLMPEMNLVQAKKFIESAPAVVLKDVGKDEADKMKEALTKVGATVVIE